MSEAPYYVLVPSGAGNTVVSNQRIKLVKVVVISAGAGAGAVQFFDNATTNAGNVPFALPATASAVVGGIYDVDVAMQNGIVVQNVASGPALAVYYGEL